MPHLMQVDPLRWRLYHHLDETPPFWGRLDGMVWKLLP